jgi:class 3 adenylate cyclase/tetratricopeptide (TPR) repeat protein
LVKACPSCRKQLPAGEFPFCPFCTAPLTAEPASVHEERKIVSVLFCDLVGFTAASEQQDPEDVRRRIRPFQERVRQEIERYGGTVEKFVGDAVMAAFGAPVAHEDDAERAVRAGLRLVGAIAELNDGDPDLNLLVRVGVNTGEAVVAVGAHPERGEGIVTGDVVNTAARIQAVAPVNAVAVSEQTHRATSRVFEYEPLPSVSVKGKREPLALWCAKAARGRFGSDIGRHKTPLVGRELERPMLIGTFERAAQQRSVQLVTIVGEPGVGKSRLVAELFAYIDGKPGLFRWKQGRCLPYGEGITFWALGEIVKAESGILESDSPDVSLAKLGAVVSPEERDRQWLLDRLAPLVGIESASAAARQELFTAWRRFIETLVAARPSVLVFEDLHWADQALLDFLEHLVEWLPDVPLVVLCTARPELYERRPTWATGLRNAQTINLPPLSDEQTAQLVSYLLTGTLLTPELERAILLRAGGNPLYAEEFVRYLADRAATKGDTALGETALPDTVQALIAARLDTLSSDRKSLLQDAAVLGKVFWAGALAEIGNRSPEEIEVALHELTRKELVRPSRASSMEGEEEYSFWHLLVRDVTYAQIPRAERARRHRAAAAWVDRKAGERVEDLAEVLAYHYLQALELAAAAGEHVDELRTPARRFLALAGERALGLDTAQAEERFRRALELCSHGDAERPELVIRWAEAAFQAGHLREAAAALDEVLATLDRRGEPETAARALQLRSLIAMRLGGRLVELAAEAVDLLEQATAGPALVPAYTQLANAQSVAGAMTEAIASADRARMIAETLGLPEPARALGYRGYNRALLGEAAGLAEMERALALLVEEAAGRDAAVLMNNLAIARYPLEGPASSLAAFEEAIAFCAQRGLAESAPSLESDCPGLLAELGRTEEALERATRIAAVSEATGNAFALGTVRATDVAIRLSRGDLESSSTKADWLTETARAIGSADMKVILLAPAAAALAREAPERACALLIEVDRATGTQETTYYARQLPAMVRTALAAGDPALATRLVDGLELRYPSEEHALCAARGHLAEEAGDHADAANLYAEAAERWGEFGNVPERAYALLGQGRCLLPLGNPEAGQPLRQAAELFTTLDYKPALAQAQALLNPAPATK